MSKAGYLEREQNGRSVYFSANKSHPFFPEISSIVRKSLGIDRIIEEIMKNLGHVKEVYILDDYAQGKDSGLIDILIIGEVDRGIIEELCTITEAKINRKLRVMDIGVDDFIMHREMFMKRPHWRII